VSAPEDGSSASDHRSTQAAAISRAITRLHREYYGRGANNTRTVIQRNYVISFLEDIYTPGERTLIDANQHQTVRETRQAFQDAMRARFSQAVEEILGRKVVAFMSQVHFDPDMSAEIFVLAPSPGDNHDGYGEIT
jgi:uncharacterized protein YbcI